MPPSPPMPISLRALSRSSISYTQLSRRISPTHRTVSTSSSTSSSSTTTNGAQKPQLSDFKRPIAKCFLGAMFTYQMLYWGWLKLETDEVRAEKSAELGRLEAEARRLTSTS